jgi:hypothetical protein
LDEVVGEVAPAVVDGFHLWFPLVRSVFAYK